MGVPRNGVAPRAQREKGSLEGTGWVPRSGGRKRQLVGSCFSLGSLHA